MQQHHSPPSRHDRHPPALSMPIAVIGMGCRLPGPAETPSAFWDVLYHGRQPLAPLPTHRWLSTRHQPVPADLYLRQGGFIHDLEGFDPAFFGISPREADVMDPQQRMALEATWHAFEYAGVLPSTLQGQRVGIYFGMMNSDFAPAVYGLQSHHVVTGTAGSVVAGRIAYTLGLRGPAITVDTACSSSLVTLDMACRALADGTCTLAIAGGVNAFPEAHSLRVRCHAHMLSPSGHCHVFDARADGYVPGEGAAAVLLKPLADAIADGDTILAVIRSTAINHDGRSQSLTIPDSSAQCQLMQRALRDAGISPHSVSYIEAHGTGTPVGDPVEVQTIQTVFTPGQHQGLRTPLYMGSLKTNVGHLESAAGAASLIKVILAMQHHMIPPHLNFSTPNTQCDFNGICIPNQPTPWPAIAGRRIAAINGFGIAGTNACAIVEEYAPSAAANAHANTTASALNIVTVSAKSAHALNTLRDQITPMIPSHAAAQAASVAMASNLCREHFEQRSAYVLPSPNASLDQTHDPTHNPTIPWITLDSPQAQQIKDSMRQHGIVFMFTGQGCQSPRMGYGLYQQQPVFRAAIDRCASALADHLDVPLLTVLYDAAISPTIIHHTKYAQPAIVATSYAMACLWQSWGIEPAAVLGHSVGEFAAACVAGALSLEETMALVAARGRLMQALPSQGAMLAVLADSHTVDGICAELGSDAPDVAAYNTGNQTVVSGDLHPINAMEEACAQRGIRTKRLVVSHAFHSSLIDPMLEPFGKVASHYAARPTACAFFSTVYGTQLPTEQLNAAYWCKNTRHAVHFTDTLRAVRTAGYDALLEVGPDSVLSAFCRGRREAKQHTDFAPALVLSSMRQGIHDHQQLAQSLAQLYVHGAPVRWQAVHASNQPTHASAHPLPLYPFARHSHWPDGPSPDAATTTDIPDASAPSTANDAPDTWIHPLLHHTVDIAGDTRVYQSTFSPERTPYLYAHSIAHRPIMPGALYLNMAARAAMRTFGDSAALADIHMVAFLPLDHADHITLQLVITPQPQLSDPKRMKRSPKRRTTKTAPILGTFEIFSRATPHAPWSVRCRGQIISKRAAARASKPVPRRATDVLSRHDLYATLHAKALTPGVEFQPLAQYSQHGRVRRGALIDHAYRDDSDYVTTIDGAFQVLLLSQRHTRAGLVIPVHIDYFAIDALTANPPAPAWAEVRPARPHTSATASATRTKQGGTRSRTRGKAPSLCFDLSVNSRRRVPLCSMRGVVCAPVDPALLLPSAPRDAERATHPSHGTTHGPFVLRWQSDPSLAHASPTAQEHTETPYPDAIVIVAPARNTDIDAVITLLQASHAHVHVITDITASAIDSALTASPQPKCAFFVTPNWPATHSASASASVASSPWDPTQESTQQQHACSALLQFTQHWLAMPYGASTPIRLVVVGTQMPQHDDLCQPHATWGALGVIEKEYPRAVSGITTLALLPAHDSMGHAGFSDLSAHAKVMLHALHGSSPTSATNTSTATESASSSPAIIACDGHTTLVAQRAPLPWVHAPQPLPIATDATYLITGGTGGLGHVCAQWLAQQGARHIAIVSRNAPPADVLTAWQHLSQQHGVRFYHYPLDLTSPDAAQTLSQSLHSDAPPLRGIIHAAGGLDDRPLLQHTPESIRTVWQPKVDGACALVAITQKKGTVPFMSPLDFFVLFSSVSSTVGQPGQFNYAAANAWLDGFAIVCRQHNIPAISMQWGPWQDVGMAAKGSQTQKRYRALQGMRDIPSDEGIALLAQSIHADLPVVGAFQITAQAMDHRHGTAPGASSAKNTPHPFPNLADHPAPQQRALLLTYLRMITAHTLGVTDPSTLASDTPFTDMGMDSLMGLELRTILENAMQTTFPATLVFEHPSLQALTQHLHSRITTP